MDLDELLHRVWFLRGPSEPRHNVVFVVSEFERACSVSIYPIGSGCKYKK